MSSSRVLAVAALLCASHLGSAQTIIVDGKAVPVAVSNVAPAAALVDAGASNATANWFSDETIQLTDAILANLTSLGLSNVNRFVFQNGVVGDVKQKIGMILATCKAYPGDLLYPLSVEWDVFDILLGGALSKTVPIGSVCYDDFGNKDPAQCNFITNNWVNNSYMHTENPTSINAVLFEGASCMPPANNPGETHCKIGGMPAFVVEAANVAQIQLAVNFARNANLRLVIKNTGHDFGAKSTGAGALSVWTHKFKDIQFLDNYKEGGYSGPALKLGAGVQAFEAYKAANKYGVTIVGGEGQTVGLIGGYIQGGGHSPLSGVYGMGADQALSFEVVTADGRFVTASEASNPDLFWAIRGGGGSTFGVVTSAVVKAHPKLPAATLTFNIMTGPTVTADQFWAAVLAYFKGFPKYALDNGNYGYFNILNIGPGAFMFSMAPWFAPNMTEAQLRALVAPLFADFTAIGITVVPTFKEYDDFYDAWWASFPLEPWGSANIRQASRLFPKANWQDEAKFNATFKAIRSTVEEGAFIIAFNIAAAPKTGFPDNAVNPAWRQTVLHAIMAIQWPATAEESAVKASSDKMTFDWMQRWRDVSPGAGAYMSESDYIEPDFTQAFWGDKYPEVLQIKKKYDPYDVFYAQNAVGSEEWQMSEMILGNIPSQNSKLCRKSSA